MDPFIRELGNTEEFREEIKRDLWAQEEVIVVTIGGFPYWAQFTLTLVPCDRGPASEDWTACPFLTLPMAGAKGKERMDGDF